MAGPPTAGGRAGEGPRLRTAGQGRASHHGLSRLAHLGRERPGRARPFPAADKRAFHRRTMRAAREDAFPIHSPRWLCSPHPRPPLPGDCKLGTTAVSQPTSRIPDPPLPPPRAARVSGASERKKTGGEHPPYTPPSPRVSSPRVERAGCVRLRWRPQPSPGGLGRRVPGATRETHVCDSPGPR